ncbi:MAG: tetratricopeptide repeat protein [Alphaproteobacteria bacterium]|jgi:tetratricopeptide (TPR) repeat protein|nr:tetratricopeptide repeat protein [Alphaproteobacteria bacterium]
MRRIYLLLFCLLAVLPGYAAASDLPRNEQPMYGNEKLPPEEQRVNDAFLAKFAKPTWPLMSNKAVDIGWRALSRNDPAKAMRRFNQGWLLNPNNGRVYWGYAVVLQVRDRNLTGSVEMFERARKLLPNNPELLTDCGRILEGGGRYKDAIAKFNAALAMDEKIPPAYYGLVRSYLGLKDIQKAAHYAKVGREFGIPLSDREIDELQRLAEKQRE